MAKENLSLEEKRTLLGLARSAIAAKLKLDSTWPQVQPSSGLQARSGAFVTLHKRGALRGCIGRFTATSPLTATVEEMALASAFEDPRFPPLSPAELEEVDLEISVLTPMRRIHNVEEIEVGRHGIYIVQGFHRGVLLPQVATENKWDRQTFLEHTCFKAGLGRDCWRDQKTEIHVFSAEVFGEKELRLK
ncbi:MAG: AmmeMemoRadiSam system protein A [Thermodesulfobacteriota bacterium]